MNILPDGVTLPADNTEKPPEPREWPTRLAKVDSEGWLVDEESGAYIRTPEKRDLKGGTNPNGWWFGDVEVQPAPAPPQPEKPEPTKWAWPEANDAPIPGGYYYQQWPTRYNWLVPKSVDGLTPRPDVEEWARYMVDKWEGKVWACTYYCHPPDLLPERWDKASVDFWSGGGRGDPIDSSIGQAIHDELFNYPGKPDIRHTIWWGWMWHYTLGWVWWGDHFDHVHVSYLED